MANLVKAGKIKFIRISQVWPATLRCAHAVHPISARQYEYSFWQRDIEEEMLPTMRGIGLVSYSPIGSGFFIWYNQGIIDRV